MVDLTQVEGFDWDAGNSRKSADKHAVTQAEAEQVFFCEKLLVLADDRHSIGELRFHALGHTDDGRLLHITFTLRDTTPPSLWWTIRLDASWTRSAKPGATTTP